MTDSGSREHRAGRGKAKLRFSFTLVLRGFNSPTEEIEDALYEVGCGDALLGVRDGVPFLDFDREASSLGEAIRSAIRDVEHAGVNASVVRVEPDDFVTASEIARRAKRSRESIRQLASGARGPGSFPTPVSYVKSRSAVWSWTEVASWLSRYSAEPNVSSLDWEHARLIALTNSFLDLRQHIDAEEFASRIVSSGRRGASRNRSSTAEVLGQLYRWRSAKLERRAAVGKRSGAGRAAKKNR